MTRAYLRLDPAFDEHKESYPDGPYAALIATFCLAEAQPNRGRFRSAEYLRRLLGKRGRFVAYLIEHGDLVEQEEGRVYVEGWDEWQEGDWKVAERVSRIRNRPRSRNVGGNGSCNGRVTPDETPPRQNVAVSGKQSGAQTSDRPPADGRGIDPFLDGLPHVDAETQKFGEDLTHQGFRYAGDKQQTELDRQIEAHGAEAVRARLKEAGSACPNQPPSWAQIVWGARKLLEPIPGTSTAARAQEADAERQRAATDRSFEATQRRIAEYTTPPEVDPAVASAALRQAREAIGAKS